MRKAAPHDKQLVIDIISEAFQENPHFDFLLRKSNREKHIRKLAAYAFDYGLRRNGVFISSDNTGAAIVYKYNQVPESFTDHLNSLRLALSSFELSRLPDIIRHEGLLKSKRPAEGEYLYFWFLGVKTARRARTAAREIRDHIFDLARAEHLSVYAETTIERNKLLFERLGFEVYDYTENSEHNLKVWFMKKETAAASALARCPYPALTYRGAIV